MPVFDVNTGEKAVAVRFSNGELNTKDRKHLKLRRYTQKQNESKNSPKPKHIVTADVDNLTYVGKDFGTTNRFPTETCDYYLGIYDKNSGKVRVVSAELYQLEPWLKDKAPVDEVDHSASSFKQKNDALAKEFGSGRSQRAVNKRDKNKLDEEMVSMTTKAVIESSHTQEQASVSSEPVVTETSAIPPYNKDATRPDDVYKLKDIISPENLNALTQYSEVFFNCTQDDIDNWLKQKKYCSFVLEKLQALALREDARQLQCQCLMYLQFLVEVFKMKAHQLRPKFPLPKEWPIPVKDHILSTFTLEIKEPGKRNQRCVPARMKDLLLSHILVLCLKLSQFDLPLGSLAEDLTTPVKRLSTHATTLGCTIKKTKTSGAQESYQAILTVPLKFPEIKARAAKKRIF